MADTNKGKKAARTSKRTRKEPLVGASANKSNDQILPGDDDDFMNPSLGGELMNSGQASEVDKSNDQFDKLHSKGKKKKGSDGSAKAVDKPIQNQITEGTKNLSKGVIRKRFQEMVDRTEKDSEKDAENSEKRAGNSQKRRGRKHEKEDEQMIVKKKTRRYNTLLTRTSPLSLFTAVKKLNAEQREKVTEMGFGSLLKMKLDGLPAGLGYYVVDNYNPEDCEIVIGTGRIKITRESIHEMIGAPHGGMRLSDMTSTEVGEVMVLRWKRQYTDKAIRPGHVLKLMNMSKLADKYFVWNFIVMFCSTMGRVKSNGVCDVDFLEKLDDTVDVARIDWCDYIYECVSNCKKKWRRKGADCYFYGPLTTLMLHYVDSVRCDGFFVKRRRPAILGWSFDLLKSREGAEVEIGGFGRGDFSPPYEEDENEGEHLTVEVLWRSWMSFSETMSN